MMEDERKRLTRLVQEEKHNRNNERLAIAAAKAKAKGKAKAKAAAAPEAAALPAAEVAFEGVNADYYQLLSEDLKVIHQHLGDISKDQPEPIAASADALGGVQAGWGK